MEKKCIEYLYVMLSFVAVWMLKQLKIHRTCPGEMEDVVKQLELATGSVVVGQIGRTVIFYRPSITKLEAEKKREHSRKVFAQRREKAQAAFMVTYSTSDICDRATFLHISI